MTLTWVYTLASVVAVSLVSLTGIMIISLNRRALQEVVFVTVSLAVGAMFGDAFIHLLPEAFAHPGSSTATALSILTGILVFFLLEKFLLWRHDHVPHDDNTIHPVGYISIVADGLHNFIDGLLIGTSYLASPSIGLATTLAVLLHEVPQEIGDFGVLVHAGFSRKRALMLNFASASLGIAGAIVALVAGVQLAAWPTFILPLTAGGFIYIAGSDLVPELHKERHPVRSLLQLACIAVGIGLMLMLKWIE